MPSKKSKCENVQKIQAKIARLDYIQHFQKIEAELLLDKTVFNDYEKMKELQKEAILFEKIGKMNAFKSTMQEAKRIELELKSNPKIEQYFEAMQDVSDLIQYLTNEIERKFNQQLADGDKN